MNNFVVPQFIDVEAKILGPITMRQFIVTLIGGFIIVVFYKVMGMTVAFFLISFLIGSLVLLFGFVKINGTPFHLFLLNAIEMSLKPKVYVWMPYVDDVIALNKDKFDVHKVDTKDAQMNVRRRKSKSRLKELSLIVDTGGVYKEVPTFRIRNNISNYGKKQ